MTRILTALIAAAVSSLGPAYGQGQTRYGGTNATGQVVLVRTVFAAGRVQYLYTSGMGTPVKKELPPKTLPRRLRPPVLARTGVLGAFNNTALTLLGGPVLPVSTVSSAFGFAGITHLQQRMANGGNQFSVEPPNPAIAAGNGYVLEGVNNAIQVFDAAGNPRLAAALSSNELFGVPAAIDRATGVQGVFPTDMRVFFDQGINRWFVVQRVQANDAAGGVLPQSWIYVAASQTGDPTGTYNIYQMETTNPSNWNCPCFADYPQIGADQYGLYISTNEFNWYYPQFVDTTILALSKLSLAAGATRPTAYQFVIPLSTGYEFAIQPATTPPGASPFLASGGVEYFVSTQASFSYDNQVAVWAMSNTASLGTASPNLLLTQILVPTQFYTFPNVANQRPGILPYGSSLTPPRGLTFLDGGDSRALSLSYAGGRLFVTFASGVQDDQGRILCGGTYLILSPTFRAGTLAASVLRQGQLAVRGNHLLRPSLAVNAAGRGAIAFTLVGADYYPSAAFLPIDMWSTGSVIQIAGPGAFPQDGFSGYSDPSGVARWGDYSAAAADAQGAIWMAVEYIPNAPRTLLANWGTYLMRYMP